MCVVHGDCPTGADYFADQWARDNDFGDFIEAHPALWETYGRSAGPRRNQNMVNSGVEMCLAFIKNESRGATDCLDRAIVAHIPTKVWRQDYP